MDNRKQDLSSYRLSQAEDSIKVAQMSYDNALFKDSINRSYYATFYAIKAVLALEEIDFKRHKDAIGYFNKTYVATEKFSNTQFDEVADASYCQTSFSYILNHPLPKLPAMTSSDIDLDYLYLSSG